MATDWTSVCRFDGAQFTFFTADDGLPSNVVYALLEDRRGHPWFATQEGASRFDGRQFANFTVRDGLAAAKVNAMVEDRRGHLWFGTACGVSV